MSRQPTTNAATLRTTVEAAWRLEDHGAAGKRVKRLSRRGWQAIAIEQVPELVLVELEASLVADLRALLTRHERRVLEGVLAGRRPAGAGEHAIARSLVATGLLDAHMRPTALGRTVATSVPGGSANDTVPKEAA